MIDVVMKFLAGELNTYLLTRTDSDLFNVELCRLVDDSGKTAVKPNQGGASVINIEEERPSSLSFRTRSTLTAGWSE